MRKELQSVFKDYFRGELLKCRSGRRQREMAPRLVMDIRSYAALECGEACCGTLTFALYLLYVCPDAQAFLDGLREVFEPVLRDAG